MSAKAQVLPPSYHYIHRHELLPRVNHDEAARFNFLANLGVHLGSQIFPRLPTVYAERVVPGYRARTGREPATGQDVKAAVERDPSFQTWSALRRDMMEQRQRAGRAVVYRQLPDLIREAEAVNRGQPTLRLDPGLTVPRYLAEVDNHCAAGGYHTEVLPDDVSPAANYEAGHFVIAGGGTGSKSDAIGRAMARYVGSAFPDFKPRRIVDLGAGAGFNTVPIALAFPDAEVIALDVAAPMLRYGHARAKLLGASNITFVQGNGETFQFEPGTVDWVQTSMVWHETSTRAFRTMLRNIHRWLRPGGLSLNMEQPNFEKTTTPFEKYVRDWDAWYNCEPFWAKLHTMDVSRELADAGFAPERVFETTAPFELDEPGYPPWAITFNRHDHEEKLRAEKTGKAAGAGLYVFGAVK